MEYRNNTGQILLFNKINRHIPADKNLIHEFTEEEIHSDRLLSKLIRDKKIIKSFSTDIEDIVEEVYVEKKIKDRSPTYESGDIAIGIGNSPVDMIERFGRDLYFSVSMDPKDILSRAEPVLIEKKAEKTVFSTQVLPPSNSFYDFSDPTETLETNVEKKQFKTNVEKKQLEVWVESPANDASGYGKFGRYCVQGLNKNGVKVQLNLHKIPDFRSSVPITSDLKDMMVNEVSLKAPAIWAVMPPPYLPRSGRKILYTMMETGTVPKKFAEKCNNADELWLPSLQNVEIFTEAKIKAEIFHMPLGIDTDMYRPMKITEQQRKYFSVQLKGFVFMSLFGWSLRKGYDALLQSYLQTFTKNDDVSLLIVSRKDGMSSDEKNNEIRKEIYKYIERYCVDTSNRPSISHIGVSMPEENLPILYNMSDCFLLPSRGEGAGMIYMEAGSCEIPVIATRCGGQLDFLNDNNSYLVDIEGYGINKQMRCLSSYYEGASFAVLGEKTIEQTKEAMRSIYKDKTEATVKAKQLRKDLVEKFQWKHSDERILERVKINQP